MKQHVSDNNIEGTSSIFWDQQPECLKFENDGLELDD